MLRIKEQETRLTLQEHDDDDNDELLANLCCAGQYSVQFFVQIFYTVKLRSLT